MRQHLTPAFEKQEEVIDWVELVLFLSDTRYLDVQKITGWAQKFPTVTVVAKDIEGPIPELPEEVRWYSYSADSKRSEIWNQLLEEAEKEWVLFVEDDEQIRFSDFPSQTAVDRHTWCPALILQDQNEVCRQFYQMRLVNASTDERDLFEGQNLPDGTRYIRERDIELYNRPVLIERTSSPFAEIDIDEELSVQPCSPKLYLIQGERYFREKKYVRAAAQYRQLLKQDKLLPFDRLAGVNGLAACLTEQHKWAKALTLSGESIKAEPLQSLSYLIQYKIYELSKEWDQAREVLHRYYERRSLYSRASFDTIMSEEAILVNLSNVALKAGDRQKASDYFEKLFVRQREDVDRSLWYKMLILSIELSDYERSVHLFNRMFRDAFPDNLDAGRKEELNDLMALFMNQEWHPFVANIYEKLHHAYPGDEVFKRRLIVALTKSNRLDKARAMASHMI